VALKRGAIFAAVRLFRKWHLVDIVTVLINIRFRALSGHGPETAERPFVTPLRYLPFEIAPLQLDPKAYSACRRFLL
jgi:hypothetical protein